ncbi:hypothetical protein [Methylobacterium brachiatum]|jgi:hypothetical protein|uniref:Uncharacterized protein n=1 Tax=Methylobacterium brachiatum TaxID=269660 RepID=A0AAJ1TP21_9HYPH|nr:hypothetical protein [Methylobacterium brachiatum]MCB4801581.1 hypothetical protein [Methylobacterium brachiatum]MDQ0544211.1 hypothetical protein [Methylobacterium brachiatum]CAA2158958.1 hypothetical protein MBRA_04200 [Methylobacterium brachiatum]SFJ72467.1 hypothetical protein SAMN02799642_05310 [Methylobacterium brachiatum]
MSVAILVALIAGALCLGMLSSLLPFGRRDEEEELTLPGEGEFFDVDGPIIDLEPLIPLLDMQALEAKR